MENEKKVPPITRKTLDSMDPEAARILIAEDAIALLEAKRLRADVGRYLWDYVPTGTTDSTQMQEIVEGWLQQDDGCMACALGSAFVASVRRFDALLASDFSPHRAEITAYLKHFFAQRQLDMIELAFERNALPLPQEARDALGGDTVSACVAWGAGLHNYNTRLLALFQNLVRNRGEFVPEDDPREHL